MRNKRAEIERALKRVMGEVADNANRGGIYARGLSAEGYAGGYADALRDVLLVLNSVPPTRHDYWDDWQGPR